MLQNAVIMVLGGGAYVLVEIFWRGSSHISMFILGGICFWIIGRLDRREAIPVLGQACMGACVITGLELLTGILVNLWLGLDVWDYSGLPGNLMGQICVYYFVLWIPLSAAAVFVEDGIRYLLFRTPFPQYRLI